MRTFAYIAIFIAANFFIIHIIYKYENTFFGKFVGICYVILVYVVLWKAASLRSGDGANGGRDGANY